MSALAGGTYRYWRDGVLQPVTEPWRATRTDGGFVLEGRRLLDGQPLFDVRAEYAGTRCTAFHLDWRAGTARALDWPERKDALIFPLLRAAMGPLLRELAAGPRAVVVPDLHPAPGARGFLEPLVSRRRVEPRADGSVRYCGGEYGEAGCECWLDAAGMLRRYRWESPEGDWSVVLDGAMAGA